jgi:tetratricopeptide (TPR) repeat protein
VNRFARLLLGACCLAGHPLASQAPADRAALAAFRDTLATITDAGELGARRQALRAAVRTQMDDLTLMRLGAVWYRLAQVQENAAAFSAARSAFEEVTERRPDWPMAWDGIAAAVLGEHQATSGLITGIVDMFGGQPNRRVAQHYLRGAQADTLWHHGLAALLGAAVRSSDAMLRDVALEAARLAAPLAVSSHRSLRLDRARLERDDGVLDSALARLEALVATEPNAADANLELARVRFMLGRGDGLRSWYRGLGVADSVVYAAYRRDLALVFADSVLAHLDAAVPADRPELARREWQRQDPDGLPVIADRLRDHYRRFDFARRHYRLRRDPPPDDPLDWAGSFDARGRIYVRHGRPVIRTSLGRHGGPEVEATLRIVGAPPNETWRYGPPDDTALLYHFVVRERGGDFTLAESALDILGLTAQYRMFRTEDVPEGVSLDSLPPPIQTYGAELVSMIAQELLLSRAPAHPVYAEMVRQGKGGAEALQLAERTIGRTSNALPSQWALQYELPLDADVVVLAVGQEGQQPTLQVGFAIAGSALLPIRTPRGVGYQVRMRAAVVNAAGEVVASVDTTRGFLTGTALRPQDRLLGRLPIPVPPGKHRVRVALEADGLGLVAPRMQVDVPAPGTPSVALSDLALGTRTVRLPWQTITGDTAWMHPGRRFTAREPLELYFEVLGLTAGTAYRVDIAVIRVSGRDALSPAAERVLVQGGNADLTLGFDQRHPGGVAGIAREISLARLRPGEYVLEVSVRTAEGTRAVRRQPFVLGR